VGTKSAYAFKVRVERGVKLSHEKERGYRITYYKKLA
jgi:hypothetical protein